MTELDRASRANLATSLTNSIGIKFKLIPAGTFMMGDAGGEPDEKQHEVTLNRPFYMGVYEVTNIKWKQVMGNVPSKWKQDDRPVEQVSWDDAVEFCRKLSAMPEERKAGRVYRLPTEAEWEYACRAGTKTAYSFGDDESLLGDFAWFRDNSNRSVNLVGQKKPNPWGLYDMHGNVWEWCSDWYGDYPADGATDPRGPPSGSFRVRRGGSCSNAARDCRSAYRSRDYPSLRFNYLGFRLALSPSGAESSEPTENTQQRSTASEAEPATGGAEAVAEPVELPSLTNSRGIQFKLVPVGTFMMGDVSGAPNEKQHEVTLTKPFYMGVYEVTNSQWKQVMGDLPDDLMEDDRNLKLTKAAGRRVRRLYQPDSPVKQVTWKNAVDFCRKLSAMPEERKAGRVYRLPTEAEWEYACRAGTTTKYSFGDEESRLLDYGWFLDHSGGKTQAVGQKKPNAWGLYDMHGNVWEWCNDWYEAYSDGAVTNPQGPSSGSLRVLRGGGWFYPAGYCRSAFRRMDLPSVRYDYLGFRLALSPSGSKSPEAKGD
jgi:formylglycine-generating enzyme required for sulfatase activity